MRALPLLLLVVLACSPGAPRQTHEPDPALGVHLLRVEGSVPTAGTEIVFKTKLSRPKADGDLYVFAQHSARREFSSAELDGGESFLFVVHDDDSFEALPPPPTGAVLPDDLTLVAAERTGLPALVFFGGPAGHAASVYLFDGDTWRKRPLLHTNLAEEGVFDQINIDAARVLDEERVLFRVGRSLLVLDGNRYRRLPSPEGATAVALGPADASGARLLWTDADGRLYTDVYDLDWELSGEVALTSRASFQLLPSRSSGTPESFTLDLGDAAAGGGAPATPFSLFFHEGGFTEVGAAPVGRSLVQAPHPTRAFRVIEFGDRIEFDSSFAGAPGEPLGTLLFNEPIACLADPCEPVANLLSDDESCRVCTPRNVRVPFLSPLPEVDGLFLLVEDSFNGGTSLYLKRAHFPFETNLVERDPPAQPFPGEGPIGAPLGQLVVSLQVLLVGLDDHSGVSVELLDSAGTPVESAATDATGLVAFPPVASEGAPYTVRVTADLFPLRELPVSGDEGAVDLGPVLIEQDLEPAGFTPGLEVVATTDLGLVERDGARLLLDGVELTTDLRPGSTPRVFNRTPAEVDLYFNEGDCAGACPLVEVLATAADTLSTTISPQFPLEALQLGNNAGNTNPFPVYADFSAGPNPTWIERSGVGVEVALQPAAHLIVFALGKGHLRWFDNGDGTDQVLQHLGGNFVVSGNNIESDLGVDAMPRLFHPTNGFNLTPARGFALDDPACNLPPYPTCSAYSVGASGGVELSATARYIVDESFVLVEDGANLDLLALDGSVFYDDVDLSFELAPNERPLLSVVSGDWWRGAAGLYRRDVLALADVDRAFSVSSVHAFAWVGDALHLAEGTTTRPLLTSGATGREILRSGGFLYFEREWASCPDAPCTVVWRRNIAVGSAEEPVARGSLYLDRTTDEIPAGDNAVFVLDPEGQPARIP